MRRGFAILFFLAAAGQAQAVEPTAIQRLTAIAQLWSDVKWYSPALAGGDIDWDLALVDALPKVEAASTTPAFLDAVTALMRPLHDPAFQVFTIDEPNYVSKDIPQEILEWLPGDVALLHLHALGSLRPVNGVDPLLQAAVGQVAARAKKLIVDMRPTRESADDGYGMELPDELIANLIDQPLLLPATRYRYHTGFLPERGITTGGYSSASLTLETVRLLPAKGAHAVPMVFIVNQLNRVPLAALALQRAGKAWILAEGQFSAAWAVPVRAITVDGGKAGINYSVAELIFADGASGVGADASVAPDSAAGAGSPAARAALKLLGSGVKPGRATAYSMRAAMPVRQIAQSYPEMRFPALPWRQLAVIKLWSTMDKFFPYLAYTDRSWNDALPEFLARMETVRDGREYALALTEMATWLDDSHVRVDGPEHASLVGEAPAGVRLASVENRVAITEITDQELKKNAQVKVGDVVVAVDNEDIQQRIGQLKKITAGSSEAGRVRDALPYALAGANGSAAKTLIEDAGGNLHEVMLPRSTALWKFWNARRDGAIFKVLPGNIGYADLDRLELKDVDAMFDALMQTDALILDMRGYPRRTLWRIASRLNVNGAKFAANISRRVATAFPSGENSLNSIQQSLPKPNAGKPLYQGKVVMLIDENTQSQAEHAGLFFEAATPITFIGSASAGANGDISRLVLPGAITVYFSGQEVRHADGRQLQRVGLQPDIKVAPTLAGIREGRDEVLERALKFLKAR